MDILLSVVTKQLSQIEVFKYHRDVILHKITTANERGATYILHLIALSTPGYFVFEREDCLVYIISSLQSSGFQVKYVGSDTLFISWASCTPKPVQKSTLAKYKFVEEQPLHNQSPQPKSILKPSEVLGTVTNNAAVKKLALDSIKKQVSFNLK